MKELDRELASGSATGRIRLKPDPSLAGSGLSNTTWFAGFRRLYRVIKPLLAKSRLLLAKSRLLQLPWFPGIPGILGIPGIPGIREYTKTLYLWSFLIAFGARRALLANKARRAVSSL